MQIEGMVGLTVPLTDSPLTQNSTTSRMTDGHLKACNFHHLDGRDLPTRHCQLAGPAFNKLSEPASARSVETPRQCATCGPGASIGARAFISEAATYHSPFLDLPRDDRFREIAFYRSPGGSPGCDHWRENCCLISAYSAADPRRRCCRESATYQVLSALCDLHRTTAESSSDGAGASRLLAQEDPWLGNSYVPAAK